MNTQLAALYKDSLVRNSLYPIMATAIMAVLGFFFWLFAARLFTSAEVGLAATLTSVMTTLATFALIGFDTSVIRFLAHEERKNAVINTAITAIGLAAITFSGVFVAFLDVISPRLAFLHESPWYMAAFMIFSALSAINIFTDAIFLANRATKFTLIIDIIFSVFKVVLPFAFIGYGPFGIFAAAALAQALGFALSVAALMRYFDYRPRPMIDIEVVRGVWRYGAGNYVADAINFVPTALLPILITNTLGPAQSAYYYIVMMVMGLLYVIPQSAMRALFAEGSYDEAGIPGHVRRALGTTMALLLPAVLVLFVIGGPLLTLFGGDYSAGGGTFLQIMAFAGLAVSAYALYGSLFRLEKNVRALIVRNTVFAVSLIGLTLWLLPHGLTGVGIAYATGMVLASIVSFILCRQQCGLRMPRPQCPKPQVPFFHNLPHRVWLRFDEFIWRPFSTICLYNYKSFRARLAGAPRCTVLFYPQHPKTYHILYKVCHALGYTMTNNPTVHADIMVRFEDVTYGHESAVVDDMAKRGRVLNYASRNISKQHVDDVFYEVFGYRTAIDPRTYHGTCVRKSNTNAVHDGTFVTCPEEPLPDHIYQLFVDTTDEHNRTMDLRVPVIDATIPFVLKRWKTADDRFDITKEVEIVETDSVLSVDEQKKVLAFAKKLGIDHGELDALRHKHDGKLYIVDANNTPAGPVGVMRQRKEQYLEWLSRHCRAFQDAYGTRTNSVQGALKR